MVEREVSPVVCDRRGPFDDLSSLAYSGISVQVSCSSACRFVKYMFSQSVVPQYFGRLPQLSNNATEGDTAWHKTNNTLIARDRCTMTFSRLAILLPVLFLTTPSFAARCG